MCREWAPAPRPVDPAESCPFSEAAAHRAAEAAPNGEARLHLIAASMRLQGAPHGGTALPAQTRV